MSEIVKISKDIDPVEQTKAEDCHKEILARMMVTTGHLLELGRLFKTVRDQKLYKLLGASTFTEYCGFPEISYARTTVYSFIGIYELYILKLKHKPHLLCEIGHRSLQIIKPPMKEEHPEWDPNTTRIWKSEWMHKANTLSEGDLINEVRVWQGKPEMLPMPKEKEDVYPFSFEDYISFIKGTSCIICGDTPTDPAHFPRTRGAGGRDEDVIPLCRSCHREEDDDSFDFLWMHKDKIFKYFYDMFKKSFAIWKILGAK